MFTVQYNQHMKIQYCSDLHIEFTHNRKLLMKSPIKPVGDILLLAGDIVPFVEIKKHLDFFKSLADNFRQVYWVPGNHEYYNSNLAERSGSFSEAILPNVRLANNVIVEEEGVKLILSTLWTKIGDGNHGMIEYNMQDFRLITNKGWKLTAEVYNAEHEFCLDFITRELKSNVDKKSIVITHHIPTYLNYPERFENDVFNDAFAVELFNLVEATGPDFWIYGHHHQHISDFEIGKTKLLNNQLGYVQFGENEGFDFGKVIEV